MRGKSNIPDLHLARKLLDQLWQEVAQEKFLEIDPDIDALINSKAVAIRYSILTQLLGKLTDKNLNALCLQKGFSGDDTSWDPRSFATKIIVPWVAEKQNVLGTSPDPYVSKPLRRKMLEPHPANVKLKDEWKLLYKILKEVQDKSSYSFTQGVLLKVLRSIYRKYQSLTFEYYVPKRISLKQTERLITDFLAEASGGDRGLAVAAALFTTFGNFFNLWKKVRREAINASDSATGLAGDIECIDSGGRVKLVIEVKERQLSLTDVRNSILKARKEKVTELLFNTPGMNKDEKQEIHDMFSKSWASGTNIYQVSIQELIHVGLSLTGENGRLDFLENVGKQLDNYNTQPLNRQKWKDLLENI